MIGKALLSGLWVCPECRSLALILTLDHVSLSSFTAVVLLTTFVATRRCRCLLQSVRMTVMPWRLLFVISGILAGEIPGFCIELCCFSHPLNWPLVFLWRFLFLLFLKGPASSWHTRCHYACTEMILSYQLCINWSFSPINWNLSRHCSVVCVVLWFVCFWFGVFVFFLCLGLFLVFFWFVVFGFLFGFLNDRDSAQDLYRSSTSLLLRLLCSTGLCAT